MAWQFAAVGAGAERPHDGLNRLTDFRRGTLVAGNASILDDNTSRRQILTLDSVGNWTGFKDDSGAGGANDSDWLLAQARKHNSINEIDDDNNHANAPDASITATSGTNWFDPVSDAAGNMTACPKPGDEASHLHLVYDAWNRLVKAMDWVCLSHPGDASSEITTACGVARQFASG